MKQFEDFITFENKNIYSIDLTYFSTAEEFDKSLSSFLGYFAKSNYNYNNKYVAYRLTFFNLLTFTEIPFIFPYVDKNLAFIEIYNKFRYVLNNDRIYLFIQEEKYEDTFKNSYNLYSIFLVIIIIGLYLWCLNENCLLFDSLNNENIYFQENTGDSNQVGDRIPYPPLSFNEKIKR